MLLLEIAGAPNIRESEHDCPLPMAACRRGYSPYSATTRQVWSRDEQTCSYRSSQELRRSEDLNANARLQWRQVAGVTLFSLRRQRKFSHGGEQTRSSWSSQERRLAFSRARRSSDDPRIWIRLPTSNGGMLKSFLSLLFDDSTSIVIG